MSHLALEVHRAFQARKLTLTKAKDRLELSLSDEQKSSSVNSAAMLTTKCLLHKNRIYAKMLVVEDLATVVLSLQDVVLPRLCLMGGLQFWA